MTIGARVINRNSALPPLAELHHRRHWVECLVHKWCAEMIEESKRNGFLVDLPGLAESPTGMNVNDTKFHR
jgi:hypothetical protein